MRNQESGQPVTTDEVRRLDAYFSERMRRDAIGEGPEDGHREADALLVEALQRLGLRETVKAYHQVSKWYA